MSQNHKSEAIVLFDGVCNLCNASINFIIDNDSKGYFKFVLLTSPQSGTSGTCNEVNIEVWIAIKKDKLWISNGE